MEKDQTDDKESAVVDVQAPAKVGVDEIVQKRTETGAV